jgi:uncharacterized membrane protein YbhN (UPF0104 family)
MIRRAGSLALAVAIAALALWFLLTPEIIAELRVTLARADWWMLGLATALTASVQWLRAWRFAIMTRGALAFPDARLVRLAFQLNWFNFVLPLRLGEISYPVLMRRAYGEGLLNATGVLILARLLDLTTVAAILFGAAALLGLAPSPAGNAGLAAAAAALALVPVALIFAGRAVLGWARRRAIEPLVALGAWFDAGHTRGCRMAVVALSFAIWMAFGVVAIVVTQAVHAPVEPAVAVLGAAATNLAFALPINGIGGLGASQAAWAASVNLAGVPWEQAVATAFALHGVVLVSALVFGGVAMIGGFRTPPTHQAPLTTGQHQERLLGP